MKITETKLKSLIAEAVDKKLQESGAYGIDWEKMALLHAQGRLKGKWAVIMTAMKETGDPEKTLAVLKSAVATLELHKSKNPTQTAAVPEEDPLDFSKLVR